VHYIVIHFLESAVMPANALVQTRINGDVKDQAAVVLAAMGLTVSDAVRLMLTRVAHDKALPFELLIPNAETIAAMQEARTGKLKSFPSVEALIADLNADG
jgi:DNA-damage-inducible protein J